MWNPKVNYSFVRGRQSLKVGYEFQHIHTQVQDVNPLYGTNVYAGQFTRPTGVAANNIYNLSDFMLGYQSQYGLSNILVANMRQNMHFAYVQDDIRAQRRLTVNVGLRYEYATPHWEARQRAVQLRSGDAVDGCRRRDGSLEERSTITPDRNNFGPRLGVAWSLTPTTVVRGGFGTSYVHFQRAGGGNILPINGPQVINAVAVQNDPTAATFRTHAGRLPRRLDRLVASSTRRRPTSPTCRNDYRSSRVDSWYVSVQRELFRNTIVDVAYVGNRAERAAAVRQLQPGAPQRAGREHAAAGPSADPELRRHHLRLERRALGLPRRSSSRPRRARAASTSSTPSPCRGPATTAPDRSRTPTAIRRRVQDFNNLDAEWGISGYNQPYNWTSSLVWDVPVGRDRALHDRMPRP